MVQLSRKPTSMPWGSMKALFLRRYLLSTRRCTAGGHQRPRFWRAHGISGGGDEHQETSRLPPIGRYVACSVRLPFVPWAVIRSRTAILGRRTLGDRGGKRSKQRREMGQNPLENGSQGRQS
jgi:hypothetical protein